MRTPVDRDEARDALELGDHHQPLGRLHDLDGVGPEQPRWKSRWHAEGPRLVMTGIARARLVEQRFAARLERRHPAGVEHRDAGGAPGRMRIVPETRENWLSLAFARGGPGRPRPTDPRTPGTCPGARP